jgi:hypothetical protein
MKSFSVVSACIVYIWLKTDVIRLCQEFSQNNGMDDPDRTGITDQPNEDTEDDLYSNPKYLEFIMSPGSGILTSFDKLRHWAAKEERIFNLAKARYQRLQLEMKSLEE